MNTVQKYVIYMVASYEDDVKAGSVKLAKNQNFEPSLYTK